MRLVRIAIVSICLLGLSAPSPTLARTELDGSWIGTVSGDGERRRLVFTIDRDSYYRRRAIMDSPDDGWMRIPASSVSAEDGGLNLEFRIVSASLRVTPKYGGKQLDGTFLWQGKPLDISLKRTAQPPAAAASSYLRKQATTRWPFEHVSDVEGSTDGRLHAALAAIENMAFLNSVLVMKDRRVLVERYFHGTDAQTLFNVKSVNKSVLSALFGIARAQNRITLDQTLCELLTADLRATASPAQCAIRMRDLLTMQAGLNYTEGAFPPGSDPVFDTDHWLASTLGLDQEEPPGSRYRYATPVTHLLAAALTQAIGEDLLDHANRELFGPLGITGVEWTISPEGIRFGGSEMFMSTRDMALLGQLYLDGGRWSGTQLLPAEWVEQSTTNRLDASRQSIEYGYLWKPNRWSAAKAYRAAGVGGQFIINVPEAELTIVTTANPRYMSGVEDNSDAIHAWIEHRLLPALAPGGESTARNEPAAHTTPPRSSSPCVEPGTACGE